MKKIVTFLVSLFALGSATTASAQLSSAKLMDGSEIATGYYYIQNAKNPLFEIEKPCIVPNGSKMKLQASAELNDATTGLWYITKGEDGTDGKPKYTIKSVTAGTYWVLGRECPLNTPPNYYEISYAAEKGYYFKGHQNDGGITNKNLVTPTGAEAFTRLSGTVDENGDLQDKATVEAGNFWQLLQAEPTTYTVNYVIKDENGNVICENRQEVIAGSAYPAPAITTETSSAYYEFTGIPDGTVKNETTVDLTLKYTEKMPFKVSTSFGNATWYRMTLNSNSKFVVKNTADNVDADGTAFDRTSNDQLWAFMGNPIQGFKVINKGAGAGKILSASTDMSSNTDGDTQAYMLDGNNITDGNNSTWFIQQNTDVPLGFFMGQTGYPDNRLNDRRASTHKNFAFWTDGADAGSTFLLTVIPALEVNVDKYYTITYTRVHDRVVGAYSAAATNAGVIDETDALRWITSEPTATANALQTLVKFEYADNGADFKIKMVNASDKTSSSGYYFSKLGGSDLSITKREYSGDYNIEKGSDDTNYILRAVGIQRLTGCQCYLNTRYNKDNSSTNLTFWNGGAGDLGNLVKIQEVSAVDLEVGEALWASVCYPFAVQLPEGVTAYNATSASGEEVTLEELGKGGDVIAANTPMFIVADAKGTKLMTISTAEGKTADNTVLLGTSVKRSGFGAGEFYALAKTTDGGVELRKNGEGVTEVPANKAVMLANQISSGAEALAFNFGTATGIQTVAPAQTEGTQYFDLAGRRVMFPANGIFVTNTGRKVYIK